LGILDKEKDSAVKRYIDYMNELNNNQCLEIRNNLRVTDEKTRQMTKEIGNLKNTSDIQNLEKDMRNKILAKFKKIEGISFLQISRITGITRQVINKS